MSGRDPRCKKLRVREEKKRYYPFGDLAGKQVSLEYSVPLCDEMESHVRLGRSSKKNLNGLFSF